MQLFITPYVQDWQKIFLSEERVVHQLSKVLRVKIGEQIAVQRDDKRLVASIVSIDKVSIEASLIEEQLLSAEESGMRSLAVALPNKFEKAELIVQKASEIGIDEIVFFPAQHSIIKEISDKKKERLQKISLEAIEQSRWKKIPNIFFVETIFSQIESKKVFVAHQDWITNHKSKIENKKEQWVLDFQSCILLVGPEGWRHADEEQIFGDRQYEKISLGKNILRMETAAIIWSWFIKNLL